MKRFQSIIGTTAVAAALAAFTGVAFANPTPQHPVGNGNGNSANAPGHVNGTPAAPAKPSHPAKPDKPSHGSGHATGSGQQATKPSHSSHGSASHSSSSTSGGVFPNAAGKSRHNVPSGAVQAYNNPATKGSFGGPGNSGVHKYTVCHNGHAITVDVHSWNAHVGRHGDTLLPYGTKGKQACGQSSSPASSPTAASVCGATVTTQAAKEEHGHAYGEDRRGEDKVKSKVESTGANCAAAPATPVCGSTVLSTIVLGVLHATGSDTNPYVLIHPNGHSAHLQGKHPEDKVLTQTVTTTPAANCSASQPAATPSGGGSGGTTGGTSGGTSGGVLGVTKTLPTKHSNGTLAAAKARSSKPAGGVLGAATRIGRTLGSAATRGTLPFTGFPLWLAVLIAALLVAFGLMLRRRGRAVL